MLLVQYSRSSCIFIEIETLLDFSLVFFEDDVLSHLVGKKAVVRFEDCITVNWRLCSGS